MNICFFVVKSFLIKFFVDNYKMLRNELCKYMQGQNRSLELDWLPKVCDYLYHLILIFCTFASRSTILVNLDTDNRKELAFEPGDHVAVFPANKASLVQELIDAMHEKPDPNRPIRIEVARENPGKVINSIHQTTFYPY